MEPSHRWIEHTLWEIPASARDDMRVPARVFADEELLEAILADRSLEQLQNVATLPGIVEAAIAMPDIHQGYGFPVGGLAATEPPDGVVSPGGVGYDINCGVRAASRPGHGADPLGLARARPSGVHRLRPHDGPLARAPRHRAARPPAVVRAARQRRGAGVSGRD